MNKETRTPALMQFGGDDLQMIMAANDVEAAFGGALAALFRDEATGVRPRIEGDRHHVVGRRHLEVQRFGNLPFQPRHVLVADMAAVLAQMGGDAVGAGFDGKVARRAPDRERRRRAHCARSRRDRH